MGYKNPEKQREYQRNWISERRKSFFLDKVCASCGSLNNLELDHKNPEEKVSHNIWSWKKERQNEELKKCQILCYKCHLKKTIAQSLKKPVTHGNSGYCRGCRCVICKGSHSKRMKLYKDTIKASRKENKLCSN